VGGRCQVAKATYRDILERRPREKAVDFVEGLATALTPMALFETFMVKSHETLVDSDTRVDVNTGLVAASRLQAVIGSRDYSIDIAEMRVHVGKISEAVGPHLRPGCYVVFDEWHAFHGAGPDVHEQRAWRVFADRNGIGWTVTGHGFRQWAVRIT
jgi:hypothetical protein